MLPKTVIRKLEAEGAVRTHDIPAPFARFIKTVFITRKDAFMSSALQAFIGELRQVNETT
jgi:DNA-binding transcriptional LysR family regulator